MVLFPAAQHFQTVLIYTYVLHKYDLLQIQLIILCPECIQFVVNEWRIELKCERSFNCQ